MLDTVSRFIHHHHLIYPGDRVLVAVSGGGDSVALLEILRRLAGKWSLDLVVAHLDHGLRAESSADAAFVAACCSRLGLPLESARVDVRAVARMQRGGLEATAREARRSYLREVAARRGCRVIALGHHRDDQAETVLERLLRGSGATGLAAMRPQSGPFVRPLLGCSRQQLQDFLLAGGHEWREDASNTDPAFTRNRIRHQLLPLLATFNPRIEKRLAALSARLGTEEDFWEELLAARETELATPIDGGLRLSVAVLSRLHPALRDRLLHRLLGHVLGDGRRLLEVHVEAVGRLLGEGLPQREVHLPGVLAVRRYDHLELRRSGPEAAGDFQLAISGPGRYPLPGGMVLEVTLLPASSGEGPWSVEYAAGQISWPLTVRSFRPGDRIRLSGGGRHRIKELLRAARLPREVRARIPLVVADEVLWVPGLRRCPGRHPADAGEVLRLTLSGACWETKNL